MMTIGKFDAEVRKETLMEEKYLSVTEFAERTGKDVGNIRRLILAGRIPAVKIGKIWAIPEGSEYPADARVKTGAYRNWRKKQIDEPN